MSESGRTRWRVPAPVRSGRRRRFVGEHCPREGHPVPEPLIDLLRLRTTPPAVPPGFLERPRLDERLTAATSRAAHVALCGTRPRQDAHSRVMDQAPIRAECRLVVVGRHRQRPASVLVDLLGALTINGAVPIDSPLRDLVPAVRFDIHAINADQRRARCTVRAGGSGPGRLPRDHRRPGTAVRSNGCWIISRRSCTSSWSTRADPPLDYSGDGSPGN